MKVEERFAANVSAVLAQERTKGSKCDFCSRPYPEAELQAYPAADYTLRAYARGDAMIVVVCTCHTNLAPFAGLPVIFDQFMTGGWGACPECALLIDAVDLEGLAARTLSVRDTIVTELRDVPDQAALVPQMGYWLHSPQHIAGEAFVTVPRGTQRKREHEPPAQTLQPLGRYSIALEAQIDLLNFYESAAGRRTFTLHGASEERGRGWYATVDGEVSAGPPTQEALTASWTMLLSILRGAQPTYVAPWIVENLAGLVAAAPPPTPLMAADVPYPAGFAYLDAPYALAMAPSPAGFASYMRAIAWRDVSASKGDRGGICVEAFGNSYRPGSPSVNDELLQSVAFELIPYGEPPGSGAADSLVVERGVSGRKTAPPVAGVATAGVVLQGLFAFMNSKLMRVSRENPDRPLRRRLEKAGWRHESIIQVVELRPRRYTGQTEPDHEGVDWSCRWAVRGHWRNQWCPSTRQHKLTPVTPYVKGPPDKPLKNALKLYAVVR